MAGGSNGHSLPHVAQNPFDDVCGSSSFSAAVELEDAPLLFDPRHAESFDDLQELQESGANERRTNEDVVARVGVGPNEPRTTFPEISIDGHVASVALLALPDHADFSSVIALL